MDQDDQVVYYIDSINLYNGAYFIMQVSSSDVIPEEDHLGEYANE